MRMTLPMATPANMVPCRAARNWLIAALTTLCVAGLAVEASAQSKTTPVRIVVFGDSLVAGFQLKASDAFPAQLERALKARGHVVEVINAGVSGDTTAAGLERLHWAVPERTDAVILELGANDALRGLDAGRAKANLDKIMAQVKAAGAEILLAGMLAPRSLGPEYKKAFDAIYSELAMKHDALLYPFFLDGVALNDALNLGDGIHPNGKGVAEITKRILPVVEQLIGRVRARQAASSKAEP
jgi:acyl-CoA thioesterase-1